MNCSGGRHGLALDDEGLLLVPATVVPGRVDAVAALAVEGAEQGEHDLCETTDNVTDCRVITEKPSSRTGGDGADDDDDRYPHLGLALLLRERPLRR